jgi:uncharacterized protein YbjT (DUF2867 family)
MVGRHVVDTVRSAGHEPVVLARSAGVDLVTGSGLAAALDGVARVIDVSNITTTRASVARAFFETTTAHLLAAGARAGVVHHVVLSIVGIDRVGFGYYLVKRRQEELVLGGGLPASVLRATQFHEFAAQLLARGGPVVPVPHMLSQPVAAREVAAALVRLTLGEPVGRAPDLAGPAPEQMADLVRRLLRAAGSRRRVLGFRLPGAVGTAMARGGLLPTGPGPRGEQTFDQWLAGQDGADAVAWAGGDRS